MTTLESIVSSQINCIGKSCRQPLFILTPVAVIENLEIDSKWFYLFEPTHFQNTDTDSNVYLRLFPDYSPETDRLGDTLGLRITFNSGAAYSASNVRRGFKATILQKERVILEVLQQLILISESSKYNQFSPIKVIDFCNLELSDRIVHNNRLATVRYGEISIDSISGLSYDQDYLSSDWSFSFKEVNLRLK